MALLWAVPARIAAADRSEVEPEAHRLGAVGRAGLVLYATAMAAPLYLVTGFSLVPLAMLGTMLWTVQMLKQPCSRND